MLINLRNAMMAGRRLPYDAEIEYLESTGTQWIDTGVPLKFPVSADMTLAMVLPYGTLDSLPVFGSRYGGGSARSKFAVWFSKSQLKFALNYGSYDSSWKGSSVQSGQVVHLHTEGAKLYIDGLLAADGGTVTTSDAPGTLTLFQMRDNSSTAARGQCVRYYSCKIYDENGILVRDFIPVRKGTVGYLYDRVSGKLFGNAGTGDFVLGPDVVPVEYIESHGTEYIDTGVVPSSSTSVEVAYKISSAQLNTCIFSARTSATSNSFSIWNDINGHYRFDFTASGADNKDGPSSIVGSYVSLKKDGNRNFVNGVEITANTQKSFSCAYPAYLFAMNNGGVANFFVSAKVASCKIGQGNTPVRSFRPVRVGNEGAMMDTLTRRIYRNAGTGAFGYGNDLKYPIPAE